MNSIEQVSEESYIHAVKGNFNDSIKNLIYGMQRYLDIFYSKTLDSFLDISNINDENIKEIMQFISVENENIIRAKCLSFVINIRSLLDRKNDSVLDITSKYKNEIKFSISIDTFDSLNKYIQEVEIDTLDINIYAEKTKSMDKLICVDKLMEDELNKYNIDKILESNEELGKDEFLPIVYNSHHSLLSIMDILKETLEKSTSLYLSLIVIRRVIKILILTHVAFATIEILQ